MELRPVNRMVATAVVLVAAALGVAAYALAGSQSGTPASSSEPAQGVMPSGYPQCTNVVGSTSSQGYDINTLLSPAPNRVGGIVCVIVILQNVDGRNLTISSDAGWKISFNITEADGAVVFQKTCDSPSASSNATSNDAPITSWTCGTFWDTSQAYDGNTPGPGAYSVQVVATVPNIVGLGLGVAESDAPLELTG